MVKGTYEKQLRRELDRALSVLMPAGWRWRVRPRQGRLEPDALFDVTDPTGRTASLKVELKARIPPADIVRQLPWYTEQGKWLLAAPKIGPRGRQLLDDARISWIELTTWQCRIAADGLYLERQPSETLRPNLARQGQSALDAYLQADSRRYVRDIFSGKALRVVRWLLIDPTRRWTLAEMSPVARASVPFVSRTFATLERDAYVERDVQGTRLRDPEALIEAWAIAPAPAERRIERVTLMASPQAVLSVLRGLPSPPRYALTAEAAAEQIAPFARFTRVELYTDTPEAWDRLMELTPVPRGGNVVLIPTSDTGVDDGVFDGAAESQGLNIVSRPQLFVDLKRRGGAAAEAADFMKAQDALWPH